MGASSSKRVQGRDRSAADEGALGPGRQREELPQPVERDELDGRRAGAAGPRADEDIEAGGQRVREDADRVARAGNAREETRMVSVLDEREHFSYELVENGVRRGWLLRQRLRQPLAEGCGVPDADRRLGVDRRPMVGDQLD